jgi:hypothetical protein
MNNKASVFKKKNKKKKTTAPRQNPATPKGNQQDKVTRVVNGRKRSTIIFGLLSDLR